MQSVARISSSFREMPGGVRLCNAGENQAAHSFTAPRGVPIVPPRGIRPFDGRFWQRCRRPGRSCGLRLRFCTRLFTVLESRPSSAQHPVVGPPVETTQSAVPRGLAELQAMRRMIAAEAHRRPISDCNGAPSGAPLCGSRNSQAAHAFAVPKKIFESKASIPCCNQAVCQQTLRTIVIRNSLNASI